MPNNETFITKPIKDLEGLNFFVDDYQRGYKWTVQQVLDLLNDIYTYEPRKSTAEELKTYVDQFDFGNKPSIEQLQGHINKFQEDFYCLQPVVVKKIPGNEKKFELIDGQQRITTLHIILSILKENKYSIEYKTRERSKLFLEKISANGLRDCNDYIEKINIEDTAQIENNVDQYWKDFFAEKEEDNIDNFFFTGAYITIKAWLNKTRINRQKLLENILNHTKIIWYEVQDSKIDSRDIFSNLNMGKIPLTNAELIKALFLLKRTDNENIIATELMQREIAAEWDKIENTLQSENFWHFLTPEKNSNPTRIELIFDLISGKKSNKKEDHFHAFRFFDRKLNQKKEDINRNDEEVSPVQKIENAWRDVNSYFLMFKEWYEDRELFHLIGYITTTGIKNLRTIIQMYRNEKLTKSDFRNKLKTTIKEDLNKNIKVPGGNSTNKISVDELNYEEHSSQIKKLLLLFNILVVQQASLTNRFNFFQYNHQNASLEHIHAQNSELLNTKDQWIQWLNEARTIIQRLNLAQKESVLKEIKDITKELDTIKNLNEMNSLEPLFQKVTSLFQDEGVENTHELYNLALLDKDINSSLNNAIFPQKRERILEKTKEKNVFIPQCTLNVFLKRYSKSTTHFHYWGIADRKAYRKEMSQILSDFIVFPKLEK